MASRLGCGCAGDGAGKAVLQGTASGRAAGWSTEGAAALPPAGEGLTTDWAVDPRNLLAPQNRRLRALEKLQRQLGDPSGWADGADRELRVHGRTVGTWRDFFDALRRAGARPHGYGRDDDGFVAAVLDSVGRVAGRGGGLGKLGGEPAPVEPWPSEAYVTPDPWLGVTEGAFPRTTSCLDGAPFPGETEGESKWGTFAEMVGEVAAMGAGRVRRAKASDVYYGALFPYGTDYYEPGTADRAFFWLNGAQVPRPDALLAALAADDFQRLTPITEMLCACLAAGVKLALTPFNHGGGGGLNHVVGSGDGGPCEAGTDGSACSGAPTWAEIDAGAPAWQTTLMVPSGEGWDPWYWDATGWGSAFDVGAPDPNEQAHQRYVLCLFPVGEGEGPERTSAYRRECARRKCLGLAAFAEGLGRWLAAFDAGCRGVSSSAGRYMALIAGPIRHHVPGIRFRAAELASLEPDSTGATFTSQCGFLVDAVRAMADEVRRWTGIEDAQEHADPDADEEAWLSTCKDAGYAWPPTVAYKSPDGLGLSIGDLVHYVGMHWFRCYNRDLNYSDKWSLYATAEELQAALVTFRQEVVDALAADPGVAVATTVGAVGFPGYDPGLPQAHRTDSCTATEVVKDRVAWDTESYAGTSPVFQAAMLARYATLLRALAVDQVGVFCFGNRTACHAGTGPPYLMPTWSNFDGMGLFNELYPGTATFTQHLHAWRQPAWYALRRLAWLLGAAGSAPVLVHNADGLTVLRLDFPGGLSRGLDGDALPGYRYGYLVWLDVPGDLKHGDPVPEAEVSFLSMDAMATNFALLPLVPEVVTSSTFEALDRAGGYRATEPEWRWPGWDAAWVDARRTSTLESYSIWLFRTFTLTLTLTVRAAHPVDAPAPLLVLLDTPYASAVRSR